MNRTKIFWRLGALMFVCFLCSSVLSQVHASVKDSDLQALRAVFAKDPVAAFELSWKMFQEPRKNNDLDGMMKIIDVVKWGLIGNRGGRWGGNYCRLLEDMFDAAIPVALQGGRWKQLGDLYIYRATGAINMSGGGNARWSRHVLLASEAYDKAGVDKSKTSLPHISGDRSLVAVQQAGKHSYEWCNRFPTKYRSLASSVEKASEEVQDGDAVNALDQLLKALIGETDMNTARGVLEFAGQYFSLRGSERIIPLFRKLADSGGAEFAEYATGKALVPLCAVWEGRNDLIRDTIYWILNLRDRVGNVIPHPTYYWVRDLLYFGRDTEAERVCQWYVSLLESTPPSKRPGNGSTEYAQIVTPLSPSRSRRLLFQANCETAILTPEENDVNFESLFYRLRLGLKSAPEDQRPLWSLEAGLALAQASPQYPTPTRRARGMTEAAALLEEGGRKDLADQARALATAFAQSDPKAMFSCALLSAQSAAKEKRWSDVEKQLEPQLSSGREASRELFDATVLLEQAKRKLGKIAEADTCLVKAKSLVNQVGLNAGEQMNYLKDFAGNTSNKSEKIQLLEQAKQLAGEAGLDSMQDGLDQQLAELTLQTGDLPGAKRALLALVNKQETKRERLAFDPLLRQQWFADNLWSYRKLLSVAAKQEDALLALGCGERMRSRALSDQLAWRKVDMAVRLPKALRQRLENLQKEREEVYALLQETTGLQTNAENNSTRGAYMPIRGAYMPIRGNTEKEKKEAEKDSIQLKERLRQLAKEEAGLESVIREAIPAYRMACQVQIPEANQLVQGSRMYRNTAILEYTLCDEGVVVVAVVPGYQPFVKLLPCTKEDLQSRVTRFRKAIQERSEGLESETKSLYKFLITPVELVLTEVNQLLIVAEGGLQLIPFSAFQDKNGKYLAEQFAISYAPSLTLAVQQRSSGNNTNHPLPNSMLIVAAPETGAIAEKANADGTETKWDRGMYMPIRGAYMPIRGEKGVSSVLTQMARIPLPGAKAEGEAVAKQFKDSKLLSGITATKEGLREEGKNCELLHIATHGYADPEVPEFSGLLLARAKSDTETKETDNEASFDTLTAQEVFLWNLQAKLVTLSACETGMGKDVAGEGVLGLTTAFLCAGAKEVVCSLWSVSDESTSKLMEQFYSGIKQGMSVETALQKSQQTMLQDQKTRHPFYWAAFVDLKGPR